METTLHPAHRFPAPPPAGPGPAVRAMKGRGAASNRSGRFERFTRESFHEDLAEEEARPAPRTVVAEDASRTVISRNRSPDLLFDRSVNPYRGCEHGCVYCFARPTHAYLGLSPGLDFETRLFAKENAPALLAKEFARPRYRCAPIALGTNTDPYQPVERERGITRGILECLAEHRHPVSIVTKSALVLRDLDLIAAMARRGLANVAVSITTLDHRLANRMEPRASTPGRRLETVARLREAGVPVSVLMAPVIPGLTDREIERVVAAAAEANAVTARYILLRLPGEVKDLFREWLEEHLPRSARRILALVRDTRGGALYQSGFGVRRRGTGPYAELIRTRFFAAVRRYGLDYSMPPLDCTAFRANAGQMELPLAG